MTRDGDRPFLAAHPGERDRILDPRTVVRRATADNLRRRPRRPPRAIRRSTRSIPGCARGSRRGPTRPRSTPFPIRSPTPTRWCGPTACSCRPRTTSRPTTPSSPATCATAPATCLTNDYEAGDAAWVTGRFGRLNAQIGAYETYDDELFGVKAFFAVSLLLRDEPATPRRCARRSQGLQEIEDALPYAAAQDGARGHPGRRLRRDRRLRPGARRPTPPPSCRTTRYLARRYGRTILLRANIMRNPEIFDERGERTGRRRWRPHHADDLSRGRRLPPHAVARDRPLPRGRPRPPGPRPRRRAARERRPALEEMKADLVSLFAARGAAARGLLRRRRAARRLRRRHPPHAAERRARGATSPTRRCSSCR